MRGRKLMEFNEKLQQLRMLKLGIFVILITSM